MDLPDTLRIALMNELAAIPSQSLSNSATQLSLRYRRNQSNQKQSSFLRSQADVAAYAAYRMPATFAAILATLAQVRLRRPDWQPRQLLDAGAGPGTAMWAAIEVWPELEQITLLEREALMIEFGKRLAAQASSIAVQQADWQQVDLLKNWASREHEAYDLVIAAYMLGEIPAAERDTFTSRLWSVTAGTLVLIEPGTPAGFSHIRQARQQIIEAGAHVLAPCPHNAACLMPGNDWCHFAQRISRTQLQRQIKQATLSYEDEKFSYVALSRMQPVPIEGRVIRHPQIRPGHIYLELCTPSGLRTTVVTRKDREAFRQARDLTWGDAIPL